MLNDTCRCCGDLPLGHLALGRRAFVSGVTAAGNVGLRGPGRGEAPVTGPRPRSIAASSAT